MENTLENKAKYFAQHWGQEVLLSIRKDGNKLFKINSIIIDFCLDKYMTTLLLLKPLSSITDEDKWEVGIRVNCWSKSERNQEWFSSKEDDFHKVHIAQGEAFANAIGKELGWGHSHPFATNSTDILNAYDFLRSKGYALPFMGLSVEKLIEYGWLKLKQD